MTIALGFLNSVCWVCFDGHTISKNQTNLVHIIDFDLEKLEVSLRLAWGSSANNFVVDKRKKFLWKSPMIEYPLAEEWKENSDKFEMADFLDDQ